MSPLLPVKVAIRNNPLLFSLIWKRKEKAGFKARVVRPGDAAVIEGYPRSANSFASIGFEITQPVMPMFGNHFHSPAQFFLARRYGVPAMLVLREPIAAALSWVVFHDGSVTPEEALYRYASFHEPLMAITDSFVVAPFEEVTSDYGATIRRFNERFGTDFAIFDQQCDSQRVFDTIDERRQHRIKTGLLKDEPLRITKPSEAKAKRRAELTGLFNDPKLDPLKARATDAFQELRSLAP